MRKLLLLIFLATLFSCGKNDVVGDWVSYGDSGNENNDTTGSFLSMKIRPDGTLERKMTVYMKDVHLNLDFKGRWALINDGKSLKYLFDTIVVAGVPERAPASANEVHEILSLSSSEMVLGNENGGKTTFIRR